MEDVAYMNEYQTSPYDYMLSELSFEPFSFYTNLEQTPTLPAVAVQSGGAGDGQRMKRAGGSMNGSITHAQDHVMAERKRREILRQRFIALSALIPGLKKIDKVSILGDTIRYVKELQERVKLAEEHATSKISVQSPLIVKTSNDLLFSDEKSFADNAIPEIEARVSNNDVLLRIHCENRKGLLPYLLNQIENLSLTTLNSSVFPFGPSKLDITIVARADVNFCMTVEDLLMNLTQDLLKFIKISETTSIFPC